LTPQTLLKMADDKVQVLKHENQWKDVEPPAVIALKLALEQKQKEQDVLVQSIVAHIGTLIKKDKQPFQHPAWMVAPPITSAETTKTQNGKTYAWCTKCHCGQGLWVCTHTTETHQGRPRRQGALTPAGHQIPSHNNGIKLISGNPPTISTPPSPKESIHAKLSIADYLDSYFDSGSLKD
jgi:hypothetical protein